MPPRTEESLAMAEVGRRRRHDVRSFARASARRHTTHHFDPPTTLARLREAPRPRAAARARTRARRRRQAARAAVAVATTRTTGQRTSWSGRATSDSSTAQRALGSCGRSCYCGRRCHHRRAASCLALVAGAAISHGRRGSRWPLRREATPAVRALGFVPASDHADLEHQRSGDHSRVRVRLTHPKLGALARDRQQPSC